MTTDARTYRIRVDPSRRLFDAAESETLLEAGLRQGLLLPHSCRDGACGTCKVRCRSGSVDHPDHAHLAITAVQRSAGFILTCQARPRSDLVLESDRVGDDIAFPLRDLPTRVVSLVRLAPDVMEIRLQYPGEPMRFHAGQHIQLSLRDGTSRRYSLANAAMTERGASRELELHIRHLPNGRFSDQVFGKLKQREILRMVGPLGGFRLNESSRKPMVLLASGTGFAPIKAMLECIRLRRIERPVHLYWGGRRPHDLYLNQWIQELAEVMPRLQYHPVLSDARPADSWSGRTGLVHHPVMQDLPSLSAHEVYACGSPVMIDAARRDFCERAQLPIAAFYSDSFIPHKPAEKDMEVH